MTYEEIEAARVRLNEQEEELDRAARIAPSPYCSFCGRAKEVVFLLIAGPAAFICNECVDSCVEIIEEEKEKKLNEARLPA